MMNQRELERYKKRGRKQYAAIAVIFFTIFIVMVIFTRPHYRKRQKRLDAHLDTSLINGRVTERKSYAHYPDIVLHDGSDFVVQTIWESTMNTDMQIKIGDSIFKIPYSDTIHVFRKGAYFPLLINRKFFPRWHK